MVPANLQRFPDLHPPFDAQSALAEAHRCLYCYDAPCTAACPTHIDVPRFIKKIASGNVRGAAVTILDANILGLSCSRVCPVEVLCEGSCVMHRYGREPIEIARLQRHAMESYLPRPHARPAPAATGPRVACIGAGPASLSCAAELARRGARVTVFERRPLPGGLNTYGVAEYKLRPGVALEEVEMIRALGVEFQRKAIESADLPRLESEFAFIFIGVGLGAMQRLNIPGEDGPNVLDALRFIAAYKTDSEFVVPARVAVLGGGNTALDAANAARRMGAESHLFYRRGVAEMAAFPFEFEQSKREGVHFHWQARPVAITPSGIRFEGADGEFACDLIVPALGQSRTGELLARIDNKKYFGGGDCVNGGREVVDAVADGKRAALAMLESLRG